MEDMQTFQNNHLTYAAVMKTLEIMERDHLLENGARVGAYMTERLLAHAERICLYRGCKRPGTCHRCRTCKGSGNERTLYRGNHERDFLMVRKRGTVLSDSAQCDQIKTTSPGPSPYFTIAFTSIHPHFDLYSESISPKYPSLPLPAA